MLGVASSGEGRSRGGGRGAPAASSGRQTRRASVLIVEDEWLVSLDMEAVIENAGHQICGVAASADEAILLAGMHRPDVVLMDIQLAGLRDGVDAAIEIYRRFGIRCVFVSANSDVGFRERAAVAGPLGWVAKPFSGTQLVSAVRAALRDTKR